MKPTIWGNKNKHYSGFSAKMNHRALVVAASAGWWLQSLSVCLVATVKVLLHAFSLHPSSDNPADDSSDYDPHSLICEGRAAAVQQRCSEMLDFYSGYISMFISLSICPSDLRSVSCLFVCLFVLVCKNSLSSCECLQYHPVSFRPQRRKFGKWLPIVMTDTMQCWNSDNLIKQAGILIEFCEQSTTS